MDHERNCKRRKTVTEQPSPVSLQEYINSQFGVEEYDRKIMPIKTATPNKFTIPIRTNLEGEFPKGHSDIFYFRDESNPNWICALNIDFTEDSMIFYVFGIVSCPYSCPWKKYRLSIAGTDLPMAIVWRGVLTNLVQEPRFIKNEQTPFSLKISNLYIKRHLLNGADETCYINIYLHLSND